MGTETITERFVREMGEYFETVTSTSGVQQTPQFAHDPDLSSKDLRIVRKNGWIINRCSPDNADSQHYPVFFREFVASIDDSIGDWYARRDAEKRTAYEALETARRSGAPRAEIAKLEKAYDRAAYVGD